VVLFAIVYLSGTAMQRCAPVAAYSRVLGQSAPADGVGRPLRRQGSPATRAHWSGFV
jgi:hypothetical protein